MSQVSVVYLRLKEEGFVCDLLDLEKVRVYKTREIPQMSEGLKPGSTPPHSSPNHPPEAQPPLAPADL